LAEEGDGDIRDIGTIGTRRSIVLGVRALLYVGIG